MQTRRSFFPWLGAWIAVVFETVHSLAFESQPPASGARPAGSGQTFKRIFKRNAKNHWAEIPWNDMRPGDRVICVGIFDGELDELCAFEVRSIPDPNDPYGHVEFEHLSDLLPNVWGRIEPEMVILHPATIVVPASSLMPGPGRDGV